MLAQPDTLLLLFGSQTLGSGQESFTQIRETLLSHPSCRWISNVIHELLDHWPKLVQAFPELEIARGAQHLQSLRNWLETASFGDAPKPLPNIVLTPLVVAGHLAQYIQFKDVSQSGDRVTKEGNKETLGLCVGLLSAFAVASSADVAQLHRYGAVAVRLAMMVGAVVDAQGSLAGPDEEAVSISVAWSSAEAETAVREIVEQFSEAYISVFFDEKRVTITTTRATSSALIEKLRAVDAVAFEILLRGRFHSPCHSDGVERYLSFCQADEKFQMPDASQLVVPTRSNANGHHICNGKLHEIAMRSILVSTCNWYDTFTATLSSTLVSPRSRAVLFGTERCVPPSLLHRLDHRLEHYADLDSLNRGPRMPGQFPSANMAAADDRIAVIGMSCHVPGANSLGEFWDLLCEGKSQHTLVPPERFTFQTTWRDADPNRKWYGNFMKDHDTFDHKFFKKSPREMASTDPQHRIMQQVAYQAVEQSGYFNYISQDAQEADGPRVGCYVGVGLVDYEQNIGCYPATAYSATGNLRSFAAGKISHYFGWTGPSLTIDTACSSSAVAIHHACRSILSGECTSALAGGVNIMTSPQWFQNLAGASFLSTTGPCKPFDAKADGYCRGEGAAAVFLKRYSDAVADGDQVLGVIAATSVYQNRNCTAITVPDSSSLSDMFRSVTHRSGLQPSHISVVEAHGTGTPVGDPAEYEGIRRVFGGSRRPNTLSLGSVKGLVGHTESASGIVSLVKALLMIYHGFVPPQASFDTINPAIKASPEDKIQIDQKLRPWDVDYRAILINNYGASGSNASMVVTQPARNIDKAPACGRPASLTTHKYPFRISAFDDRSLAEYCSKLLDFIVSKKRQSQTQDFSLANLSFQVVRQSNRSLPTSLIFESDSIEDLAQRLNTRAFSALSIPQPRPVILCFGGQISTFVGLDKQVYESATVFRRHLDECDRACRQDCLLEGGIYPEIFRTEPLEDIVKLQVILFANQYACAKSWIDCGVSVAAVCGHSFGELTALCVSGIVSLTDALRMIAARAKLIKEAWGEDKGAMMAVEADRDVVQELLAEANQSGPEEAQLPASIACYNGPRSFTIAGSTASIDKVSERLASNSEFSSIRFKRLNVTNAFHSSLVEPLLSRLKKIGQTVSFADPVIPFERATEFGSPSRPKPEYLSDHLRQPVWFNNAVQRLNQMYPSAIWLEAGSSSTITAMASRALASPRASHFQAINITSSNGLSNLSNATISLWKEGLNVSYWLHHYTQVSAYEPLLLPPYQFERLKHWMDLKEPPKASSQTIVESSIRSELPQGLWTFVEYQDELKRSVSFRINTEAEEFRRYVSGHKIAQAVEMCPSILQIGIAVDAITSLYPGFSQSKLQPTLKHMVSHAPMAINRSRVAWLEAKAQEQQQSTWDWKIVSKSVNQGQGSDTLHISGQLVLLSELDSDFQDEFARLERLVGAKGPRHLLDSQVEVDEIIQGRNIYRSFAEIVEYSKEYRGVQKIVGKGLESAGRVLLPYDTKRWLNVGLADSFCQVAGIFVNCMTDRSDKEIYISDRIERWIRSPGLTQNGSRPDAWDVYACHSRPSQKEFVSDIFVFDSRNGQLAEAILGVRYQRVSKPSLVKHLLGLSSASPAPILNSNGNDACTFSNGVPRLDGAAIKESVPNSPILDKNINTVANGVVDKVRGIICNLSGLEEEEIKGDSDLIDLGIDSLMGMELAREIETIFSISLDTADLLEITDFQGLVKCIQDTMGVADSQVGILQEIAKSEVVTSKSCVANGHARAFPFPNGKPGELQINGTSSVNGINRTNGANGNQGTGARYDDVHSANAHDDGAIAMEPVVAAFRETKLRTDEFIVESGLAGYVENVLPPSNELCVVHILDAFEQLGCSIRSASPGQVLPAVQHLPRHTQYIKCLHDMLTDAGLVEVKGTTLIRTSVPAPSRPSQALLEELVQKSPAHESDHRLASLAGFEVANCLVGKADGVQLLFSSSEGRDLASSMYGRSPINTTWIQQMVSFIKTAIPKISTKGSPVKILELGAGTGGTTAKMAALFASMDVPIEYTVTDISSSLVAGARKRFKQYPFMRFRVHDIEKPPTEDMLHSQHLVIATNCVHATHNLTDSTRNIHDILHPTGFLLMLEMTQTLAWIDLIFGLLEGWWLFNDGRRHALTNASDWERTLHSVGYGHVDWTEGHRPEANIQRLIIAFASAESRYVGKRPSQHGQSADIAPRQEAIDSYVRKYARDFDVLSEHEGARLKQSFDRAKSPSESCVVITGATGSLGCQLVAYFARLASTRRVICLNRPKSVEGVARQQQALESRGISLDANALSKLRVFQTDTSKSMLGLDALDYDELVASATHIVHNAWPMSITRPVEGFEAQFRAMRNLVNLARDVAANKRSRDQPRPKIAFQFISSIATAGYYSRWTGQARVPEESMAVEAVLPCGYGDAKLVCERMLEETLNKHPSLFRAMTVRIGQIAGCTSSGYWNPVEHLAFLIKSCQTINALPALRGDLSWCPVTTVAATLGELLLGEHASNAIYHVENPTRQPWPEMLQMLSDGLIIPPGNLISFSEWVKRVKEYPGSAGTDNPAGKIIEFLEEHFVRMSCGDLVLDTTNTKLHSRTLATETAVSSVLVQKYIWAWREMGFLK